MSDPTVTQTVARFEAAVDAFDTIMHQVAPDHLGRATPCEQWDVRALAGHVVAEMAWVAPLLDGRTVAQVGDAFDGDLLGGDPCAAWHHWSASAHAAFAADGATGRTVHLSYGDERAAAYCDQLSFDLLVHSWDLSQGIRADAELPGPLVSWARRWFEPLADAYRSAGVVQATVRVAPDAAEQVQMLALAGRRADWRA